MERTVAMKRRIAVFTLIVLLIGLSILLYSCDTIDSSLVGTWTADAPDEQELRLGHDPRYGSVEAVKYRISRDGALAIEFSYSASSETQCFDTGFVTVKGNRIHLNGQGTYTVDGSTLTICYDDGTERTFTREE